MFCTKCGRQLNGDESFCPVCGTASTASAVNTPSEANDPFSYGAPDEGIKDQMAGEALKWGIMSLAFSASCLLALLGLIFSFTAKRKCEEYQSAFGEREGRARVGHVLGRVGFGLGLGYTIFWGVYFSIIAMVLVILAISGAL